MKPLSIGLIALFAFSFTAWSGMPALEGIVKDAKGQPIKAAQVRVEGKNFAKTVTTDTKGHYVCDGLATGGSYKVTLLVNGSVKASILNTKIQSGNPTQLSFNLRKEKGSANRQHRRSLGGSRRQRAGGGQRQPRNHKSRKRLRHAPSKQRNASSARELAGKSLPRTPRVFRDELGDRWQLSGKVVWSESPNWSCFVGEISLLRPAHGCFDL